MSLEELRSLLTELQGDTALTGKQRTERLKTATAGMSDEQITQAMDAIRALVSEQRTATPNADVIATLRELREIRGAVIAEQTGRAETAAQVASETEGLLSELENEPAPDQPTEGDPVVPAEPPVGEPPPSPMVPPLTPAQVPAPADVVEVAAPDLQAVAASLTALADVMKQNFAAQQTPAAGPEPKPEPVGRPAGRIGQNPVPSPGAAREAVTLKVHASGSDGTRQHGQELTTTHELGRVFADRLRAGNGAGGNGRQYVARVDFEYPESRKLSGSDSGDEGSPNFDKIEAVTSPRALVAAGGLCAPLETLYDVEVIGSTARPVRDALARFGVDRGGIQYRPNMSAAAAVYGAGTWTVAQDAANPVGSKGCYVVDCPGIQTAVIQAIYLCLEFSNISTRFDPEVTAANVQKGLIAQTRVAENALLASVAAGSKVLSAPQVIGATRDILVNLDKATAYYRNRHRLTDIQPLTFILPGWVKSMMRADIARQIAAGDWISALGIADSQINMWFATRSVTPVWHLDGPTGADEVQTVTITGAPTGGTFTLTYAGQTTTGIAYNASAATVQTALENLSNIDPGDVTVTGAAGGPYTVLFDTAGSGGQFHGVDVAQMTTSGASLTGGTTPASAVTTTTAGGGAITVNGVSIASQTYNNAAAGSVLPGFPDQIDGLLFVTGTWLFLDGGSLDLGLVRDSLLNDRNRYRQFMETFEGTANRGIESLRLVMTVEPTGTTSGTKDISAIND